MCFGLDSKLDGLSGTFIAFEVVTGCFIDLGFGWFVSAFTFAGWSPVVFRFCSFVFLSCSAGQLVVGLSFVFCFWLKLLMSSLAYFVRSCSLAFSRLLSLSFFKPYFLPSSRDLELMGVVVLNGVAVAGSIRSVSSRTFALKFNPFSIILTIS